jgi:membrane-associated HD superfamily phosphohydrolase
MDSADISDNENTYVEENSHSTKSINITGTNNRYQIKKLTIKEEMNKIKIRKETQKWNLSENVYNREYQYEILNKIDILNADAKTDISTTTNTEIIKLNGYDFNNLQKLIIQQLERKLNNYKQQDLLKKVYNPNNIITLEETITKLKESELLCYYCKKDMLILYEIVRENLQWTLDRIDNSLGHTKNNVIISCLNCNLKRRKQSKDAFLFTKQLQIVKKE